MIQPAKYLDLNTCVLRVAAEILLELQDSKVIPLDELNAVICSQVGDAARFNFIPSLSFLFLLGKLDYDSEADVILFLDKKQENQL
jgi:hypothetical protein